MNPIEAIENDRRLTAIYNGLVSIWQDHNENIVSLVLFHTDDYDLANEVLENYFENPDENYKIEEALFECMDKEDFESNCLGSEYLNHSLCIDLFYNYEN